MSIFTTLMNFMSEPKGYIDGGFILDSCSPTNKLPKITNKKEVRFFDVSNFLYFKQITAFWGISVQLTRCSKTIFNNNYLRNILQEVNQKIHNFTIEFISMHTPLSAAPIRVRHNSRVEQLHYHQSHWDGHYLGKRGTN